MPLQVAFFVRLSVIVSFQEDVRDFALPYIRDVIFFHGSKQPTVSVYGKLLKLLTLAVLQPLQGFDVQVNIELQTCRICYHGEYE